MARLTKVNENIDNTMINLAFQLSAWTNIASNAF